MSMELKDILEGLLMASEQPLSVDRILGLLGTDGEPVPERSEITAALDALTEEYGERGIELVQVASGYRFQVRRELSAWVNRLFDDRPPRYSRAVLETLAIIAYRQPITRGEIEAIRGVSIASSTFRILQEREWIRVVGHRDVPGKPALYATSRNFLDYFNLKSLDELPPLAELKDIDALGPDLFSEEAAGVVPAIEEASGESPLPN